jgi:hypothetical protein
VIAVSLIPLVLKYIAIASTASAVPRLVPRRSLQRPAPFLTHVGATEWIVRSTFWVTSLAHEQLIEVNVSVKNKQLATFQFILLNQSIEMKTTADSCK